MTRFWLIIGLLIAVAMAVSCGPAPAAIPPETSDVTPEESETASSEVPQVLTVNFRLGATTLDPHKETASSGERALSAVYDRLVVMDSNMEIQPQLAKDWEVSEDGLTWAFHLRPDVKFHDGTEFNAEAVKFTIERVLDPETQSRHAADYSMVDSIEVVDDQTVRFHLKYPFAAFHRTLGLPGGMIVCPSAVEKWGEDFGQHGCGAGPFKVDKFIPEERTELVRFDDYWQGPAELERIVYTHITDEQARISALLAGDTDFEETVPGTHVELLEQDPDIVVERGPAMMTEYIGFQTELDPFGDARVRRAVGYAIDMAALIKGVMRGIGIHASQPLSPLAFGYEPELSPLPYDPDKAEALLAEAGWEDTGGDGILDKNGQPFKTTFCIMDIPQMVKFVEAAQANLKDVGIDASIQVMDWGSYMAATKEGTCPMFIIGYGANTGDADTVLWTEFHSSMIPTGNRTRYSNPEVDELLAEQRKELDPEEREELLQEAVKIIVRDAPWVPTFVRENLMAHHKKVKGFELNPSDSYINFYSVYIEGE